MAAIDSMILSAEEYTLNANSVKDMIIQRLLNDRVISEENAMLYTEKWQVIVVKNNWFERWMKKFDRKKDSWSYKYLKFED